MTAVGDHASGLYVEILPGRTDHTVLLLHGGGVGGWMWRPLLAQLGKEWTFIVPDLPGHDRSAQQDYRSHQDTVEALIDVIEKRARKPVIVVGFSLGAQLAVLLASLRPDLVARVAIISAQARPTRFPGAVLALLRLTAPLAKSARFARAQAKELFIPAALFPDYLRTSRSLSTPTLVASVGANIRFTVPRTWSSFPGQALVLVGARERHMMQESARIIADAHPGSTAEIIDGCGHGIPLQKPAWLAQRLINWLQ